MQGKAQITIKDTNGNPIPNAKVEISSCDDLKLGGTSSDSLSAVADEHGVFRIQFSGGTEGKICISTEHTSKSVDVTDGSRIEIEVGN